MSSHTFDPARPHISVLLCAFPCSASLEGTAPGDLQQRVKFFGSVLFKDFNETRSVSLLLKVCVFFLSGRIFAVCLVCVCVFAFDLVVKVVCFSEPRHGKLPR